MSAEERAGKAVYFNRFEYKEVKKDNKILDI
jgi:hypothetical protein